MLVGLLATAGPHRVLSQGSDTESAPPTEPEGSEQPGAEAPPGLEYEVAIEGVEDDALRDLLLQVSETQRLIDSPPRSLARLRRRAQDDRPRLLEALRSGGYYSAEVTVAIDVTADPVRVRFQVDPGPVYRLRSVSLQIEPPDPQLKVPSLADLGLELGQPAAAQTILDGEAALLSQVRDQGFALAELGDRRAVVDHETDAMDLTLRLTPGPLTHFGPITFEGLSTVEQEFVANRLGWQEGELITPARLTEGRDALRETELFSAIRFDLADSLDKDGQLPVTVDLTERKHRSFGVGVRYRTDEGPGGSLSWEHRNYFGNGERVGVEFDGSFIGLSLVGNFRKPDFGQRDQALVSELRLGYDDTDAFEAKSVSTRVGLERRLAEGMTGAAGIAFRAEEVKEAGADSSDRFALLSLPARFDWDRSDDPLDPSEGGRLGVANEPFVDVAGNGLLFNKSRVDYSHYFEVLQEPQVVLAGRTAVGTLFGESREDVPANLRFYAGGGGSVRGFGYQLAGKLNDDDDPIGGRSLLELSGEVRVRVTESIGVVAFVDSGTVYTSSAPDFSEPLRVGAGPGLRYFSPIGPLRLDVGFPLNPRNSDDTWQLYISVGQAF